MANPARNIELSWPPESWRRTDGLANANYLFCDSFTLIIGEQVRTVCGGVFLQVQNPLPLRHNRWNQCLTSNVHRSASHVSNGVDCEQQVVRKAQGNAEELSHEDCRVDNQ